MRQKPSVAARDGTRQPGQYFLDRELAAVILKHMLPRYCL